MLLDAPAPKTAKPKSKPQGHSRQQIADLRQAVSTAEARVEKLTDLRDRLASKLADPAMYEADRVAEAESWQKKFAEVEDGLERAEALWMRALEKLEAASG
jgi:ATP-binding cassette subfamily F protein 3